MNIIGIIMEANPLHNGHQYFINKIKSEFSADVLVALTTTSFTMRGEISVIDKFTKTNALLNAGANLVLEFPFILSTQSSDYFSLNAISILNSIGINQLVCGCETDDEDILKMFLEIETSEKFKHLFKINLETGSSYKKTYTMTLMELGIDETLIKLFNEPNFTLAYQYYKVIKKSFPHIKLTLIKRTNHYYDLDLSTRIVSAKAIRSNLINNQEVNQFVPFSYQFIDLKLAETSLFSILKYLLITNESYPSLINHEGIINYLTKKIIFSHSYEELIKKAANKRYSASRINRTILYLVTNINQFYHQTPYLRILGLDKLGTAYLGTLNKNIKTAIFASIQEINDNHQFYEIAKIEHKATQIFSLITNTDELIQNEYKLPIRKKE